MSGGWGGVLEHLGDLDDGWEPTPGSPRIQVAEERSRALGLRVGPEPVELLFDGPRPSRFEVTLPDCLESPSVLRRKVLFAEEPYLPGAFEAIIIGRHECLVLGSSDLVDGFAKMLRNVESIVQEFGIWQMFGGCVCVSRQHVCSDGLYASTLLVREAAKDELCG